MKTFPGGRHCWATASWQIGTWLEVCGFLRSHCCYQITSQGAEVPWQGLRAPRGLRQRWRGWEHLRVAAPKQGVLYTLQRQHEENNVTHYNSKMLSLHWSDFIKINSLVWFFKNVTNIKTLNMYVTHVVYLLNSDALDFLQEGWLQKWQGHYTVIIFLSCGTEDELRCLVFARQVLSRRHTAFKA